MSDAHNGSGGESEAHAPAAAAAPAGGGGIKAWLPLLVTIVAMPALAYTATTFLIVPKIHQALGHEAPAAAEGGGHGAPAASGHGAASGGHGAGAHGAGTASDKQSVALNKIIVNVAGTMGTRYLLTSVTLVGSAADFKARVDEHRDELLDIASSSLSNKTIADLEKPGARNIVRTELLAGFNAALGEGAVREIFITEFAIQ